MTGVCKQSLRCSERIPALLAHSLSPEMAPKRRLRLICFRTKSDKVGFFNFNIMDTLSQSILKEINPDYSLEKLMLKLKHQYSGDSLEKTLMLEKIEGRRKRG